MHKRGPTTDVLAIAIVDCEIVNAKQHLTQRAKKQTSLASAGRPGVVLAATFVTT